ncbi:MAG TPA: Rid family detoxifying hydrolase [Candidatus Omnitrophota bacterium]|nr:Rid family detoxifying hydrolase [Candidatus Omnitrophota bacterium]
MSKKIIKTDKASLPVGPYNQAVAIGGLVYTAGQVPLDKQGNMVPGGIKEQTEQVIANLKAVLEAAGSSLDKAVKATVFLKDLNDFAGMNEVYAKHFKAEAAPARSTLQVSRIPKDSLVEIEVVAHI